jgi:hypothetical protein
MTGVIFKRLRSVMICSWLVGITSHAAETGGAGGALNAADEEALRKASQGAVVRMENFMKDRRDLPRLTVKIDEAQGPQFLLSDRPEYFLTENGIALQEEVKPGVVRLYIYHVPEATAGGKVISAVIENLGRKPMSLRFLRYAFPAPGTDYQRIAKDGLNAFLRSEPEKTARSVSPGKPETLDPRMDQTVARKDQLVHGFYEFEIDQPARVSVFQRDPEQISSEAIESLPKLPRILPGKKSGNGAGRGIFRTCNFTVTNESSYVVDTTNGPTQLIVADGKRDGWIRGHDSIENKDDARDAGNYGVMYRIRLTRASSDGRGLALLLCNLNARSQWCGRLAAAVEVNEGVFPGGVVRLPKEQPVFGEAEEAALIQKFPPLPKGKTGTIELVYSPPGAACIPTPLLLVPYQP